ncbi:MAG: tetratricopeptide repeat protein [Acidobacteriaceae bacterium]|nr:tetratricopeptide repeat protein [Acidobacteriaceae bacterium]MBV9780211.1 tetratricopeptide repeat protein [Acidobacteriaceae bacterium]
MIRTSALFGGVAALFFASGMASGQAGESVQQQIQAHARQAQEDLRDKRPDVAAKEFTAIVALDPNNIEARGNLGVLLFFQHDFTNAAPQLRAALQLQPSLWKIEALLGMCERRIGQAADAQADLEKSFPQLTDEKLRIQAGMELIEIYYGSGTLDKAAGIVSALRQLRPTDVDILYTANRIYSDLADESMLSLAMLAPDSARMHQMMAHEAARQGNTQGAIAQYREAMKLDPNIPGLHFELAEALAGSSQPSDRAEVEREYKAALTANPFDERAECRLGEIAARESDVKAAEAHYSRALQLQPNDAGANLGLAKTLIAVNQSDKAIPLLERAAQIEPFNAAIHYHLSTLYRNAGRTDDAKRELVEFRRLRGMKARLTQIYQAMRLQPSEQERPDQDVPK